MIHPNLRYAPHTIVPTSLLPTIGHVAALYSHLDIEVNRTIWWLMGVDERIGRTVTQNIMNYATRIELLFELSKIKRDEAEHDRLREIKSQLRYAGDDRNRLIHDEPLAGSAAEPLYMVQKGHKTDPGYQAHVFDETTLDDLAHRLGELKFLLINFQGGRTEWMTRPLPSLDKSPTLRLRQSRETPSNPCKPKRQPKSSRRTSRGQTFESS